MSYRTVTVDVDVDVDLSDFDNDDLIEELRDRGYSVVKKERSEFSWNRPSYEEEELDDLLWKLRQAYIIDNGDQFRKSFEKILSEYGYHT